MDDIISQLEEKYNQLRQKISEDLKKSADQFEDILKTLQNDDSIDKNEFDKAKNDLIKQYSDLSKTLKENLDTVKQELNNVINSLHVNDGQKELIKKATEGLLAADEGFTKKLQDKITEKLKGLNNLQFKSGENVVNIEQIKAQADIAANNLTKEIAESVRKSLESVSPEIKQKNVEEIIRALFTKNDKVTTESGAKGLAQLAMTYYQQKGTRKLIGAENLLGMGLNITAVDNTMNAAANMPNMLQGGLMQLYSPMNMLAGSEKNFAATSLREIEMYTKMGLQLRKEENEFLNNLEEMKSAFSADSGIGKQFKDLNNILTGEKFRRASLDITSDVVQLYGATDDNLIKKRLSETSEIIKSMGPYSEMMTKKVLDNVTHADARVSDYYYKAKKLMNLSDDDILKLTTTAVSLGKSFPEVFHDLSKATKDVADKFNLDFKRMSVDVLTLRKDITNFGHKSSQDLAMTVAQIKRLGVSTQDAMSIFNKFQTFDDAATTAAQLSQSFGMVIDSMELLKAESPDEMLQIYKDAFIASGKTFETMNRFERGLLLQQTGLSEQAAQALFSAENAGKSYEEVMSDIESKDVTEDQILHMEEMKGSIEVTKQSINDFKGYLELQNKWILQNFLTGPIREKFLDYNKILEDTNSKFANTVNFFEKGQAGEALNRQMSQHMEKVRDEAAKPYADKQLEMANSLIKVGSAVVQKDIKQIESAVAEFRKQGMEVNTILIQTGAQTVKEIMIAGVNAIQPLTKVVNEQDKQRSIEQKQKIEGNQSIKFLQKDLPDNEILKNQYTLQMLEQMKLNNEDLMTLAATYQNFSENGNFKKIIQNKIEESIVHLKKQWDIGENFSPKKVLNGILGLNDGNNTSEQTTVTNNPTVITPIAKPLANTVAQIGDFFGLGTQSQPQVQQQEVRKETLIQQPVQINISNERAAEIIINIIKKGNVISALSNPAIMKNSTRLTPNSTIRTDGLEDGGSQTV